MSVCVLGGGLDGMNGGMVMNGGEVTAVGQRRKSIRGADLC